MSGKRKTWKQATEDAIVRVCRRKGTAIFDFDSLAKELPQIVEEVQSKGKTPKNSLRRFLQDLRKAGKIAFLDDQGTYKLLPGTLSARAIV